jgi:hypothetical protein
MPPDSRVCEMVVCIYACVCVRVCPGGLCQQVSVCNCRNTTARTQEAIRCLARSTVGSKQAGCPPHWGPLSVREDSSFCNTEVQNASQCVLSYDCKNFTRQDSSVGTCYILKERVMFRFPRGIRDLSLLHSVHIGSGSCSPVAVCHWLRKFITT